jgi:hypothetical protein
MMQEKREEKEWQEMRHKRAVVSKSKGLFEKKWQKGGNLFTWVVLRSHSVGNQAVP